MNWFLRIVAVGLIFTGFTQVIEAQNIVEEPLITQMMKSYVDYHKNHTELRGWRIQLIATTDKRQMESARKKFAETYPDYDAVFTHVPPFFHLKAGAFLKKQDALPFLERMKETYPGAFLVADQLEAEELLRYQK